MKKLARRAIVSTFVTAVAAVAATGVTSPGTAAADRWAAPAKADITPGVQMFTQGAQCTGNFVFTDAAGHVYVGYAAHCAGKGAATDTNGCKTASYPVGTAVRFEKGATYAGGGTLVGRGTLAYSSWRTMQKLGTAKPNVCQYNDLALVQVAAADVGKVNPSVPFWGGPTGLRTTGLAAGDQIYSYGNSILRGGVSQLSPKTGVSVMDRAGGWSHVVYTASPGIPGDSGSGFLDSSGRAFGVLSTLDAAPDPGGNGVGDLAKELAFAQRHSGISGLRLANGTVAFSGTPAG
jgi:hypothetical protein